MLPALSPSAGVGEPSPTRRSDAQSIVQPTNRDHGVRESAGQTIRMASRTSARTTVRTKPT